MILWYYYKKISLLEETSESDRKILIMTVEQLKKIISNIDILQKETIMTIAKNLQTVEKQNEYLLPLASETEEFIEFSTKHQETIRDLLVTFKNLFAEDARTIDKVIPDKFVYREPTPPPDRRRTRFKQSSKSGSSKRDNDDSEEEFNNKRRSRKYFN